jgi:hypothetical protein
MKESDYTIIRFVPYETDPDSHYRGCAIYRKKDMPNGTDCLIGAGNPLYVGTEDECRAWITVAESHN